MQVEKISISLPTQQCEFLTRYQVEHHYKSRSEVVRKALYLLQQTQLESYYQQANSELNSDFDALTQDGLDDEAW